VAQRAAPAQPAGDQVVAEQRLGVQRDRGPEEHLAGQARVVLDQPAGQVAGRGLLVQGIGQALGVEQPADLGRQSEPLDAATGPGVGQRRRQLQGGQVAGG
jgi:hypothetical protein